MSCLFLLAGFHLSLIGRFWVSPEAKLQPPNVVAHRLIGLENGEVSFRWRDSAHKNKKRVMTLRVEEFLRRFFLHVLPTGFVRIRHFGLFSNRIRKVSLELCRRLLEESGEAAVEVAAPASCSGKSFWACPDCGTEMVIVERIAAVPDYIRPPPCQQVVE